MEKQDNCVDSTQQPVLLTSQPSPGVCVWPCPGLVQLSVASRLYTTSHISSCPPTAHHEAVSMSKWVLHGLWRAMGCPGNFFRLVEIFSLKTNICLNAYFVQELPSTPGQARLLPYLRLIKMKAKTSRWMIQDFNMESWTMEQDLTLSNIFLHVIKLAKLIFWHIVAV